MNDTQVLIAGAGPTGLMLACELRLAGVDVLVLERLRQPRTAQSRAGGLHIRTLEAFDQRGILDRFLERGRRAQGVHFAALPLDVSDAATRHPYVLVLVQAEVERLLAERAVELGASLRRGAEVTGFTQDDAGVTVELADSSRLRARYLVGCDGGRSTVRRHAGIGFPGTPATMTALLGDVELAEPPATDLFQQRREHGSFSVLSFGPDWYRVLTNEFDRVTGRDEPVSLDTLRTALVRIAGTDFGLHSPRWLSRHSDAARQADRYRAGRVLLAGDAAHIHFPAGGQGLNTGVQDAVNLGWKLAEVVSGRAPVALLDTYQAERHPVGARVLQNTRAQIALWRVDEQTSALRAVLADLTGIDAVRRRLTGAITATDLRYPIAGADDDLVGRRMPDLDIGAGRVYELLHRARPVLLDLGARPALAAVAADWAGRVDVVRARAAGDAELDAVLIRPDGHVAWVARAGEKLDTGALRAALTGWLGPAASSAPGQGL